MTDQPLIDISPQNWRIVRDILQRHVPDREVWAFGSRAKWTAKDFSDLDIAIIDDEPMSISLMADLREAFQESALPFKIDIVDWAAITPLFRKVIEVNKVSLLGAGCHRHPWPIVRLGDHCVKIGSGATPKGGKEAYLASGPYYLIRSQNIYNEGFSWGGLAYISEEQAKKLDGVAVNAGDVLLNITGDSVARVCSAPEKVIPARVNQHVAIIRPDDTSFDSRFIRYFLASPKQQDLLLGMASAGATRNALTKGMIEDLRIPKPSMPEQTEIADVLSSLDDKIVLLRETNATLEAIAQSVFKSWFVDFDPVCAKAEGREPEGVPPEIAELFPSEFEESELGHIPKGWNAGCMGDVVSILDSKRIPLSGRQRAERKGVYPYYGAASVMDYVDDYLFDGVHVLMGEDGSVANLDGTPIVQYVWGKFWVNNHAHVLLGKNGISNEHLLLSLKRTNITAYMTGAVQAKLNQGNLCKIPFLLPSHPVCQVFGEFVEAIFSKIRLNTDAYRSLSDIRDSLLPRLMSGSMNLEQRLSA